MIKVSAKKILTLALGLSLMVMGVSCAKPGTRTIKVIGSGEVTYVPDTVSFTVTIREIEPVLKNARAITKKKTQSLLELCKKYSIADEDVKTSYSETGREYEWEGNNRVFKGFRSEQSTKINLKDISKLEQFTGEIFELQVYSIGSFRYSHSKQNEFDAQANLLALDDAKVSAEKMADRMGVKICEVLYISDIDTSYSYSDYLSADYGAISQNKSLNSTSGFVVAPGILSSNREVVVTYRIK